MVGEFMDLRERLALRGQFSDIPHQACASPADLYVTHKTALTRYVAHDDIHGSCGHKRSSPPWRIPAVRILSEDCSRFGAPFCIFRSAVPPCT
jgi:hypothetical protein